jgi:hypothetical protein
MVRVTGDDDTGEAGHPAIMPGKEAIGQLSALKII